MAFKAVAFIAPNYRDYKNWWLKAYNPSTTTPKPIAIDTDGNGQAAKIQLNKDGFPVTSGGAIMIPHVEGAYDLYLFPTAEDADNNDTANAERLADNIDPPINEEWINCANPTYISATQVSIPGDQTGEYTIGRKVRINNTPDVVYSTINNSTYDNILEITTVTVSEPVILNSVSEICASIVGVDSFPSVVAILNFTVPEAKAYPDLVAGDLIVLTDRANSFWDVVDSASVTPNDLDIILNDSGSLAFVLDVTNDMVSLDELGSYDEVALSRAFEIVDRVTSPNNAITLTSDAVIPPGKNIEWADISGDFNLNLNSSSSIHQVSFDQVKLNVSFDSEDSTISFCGFDNNSFINCVAGFSRGPNNLTVSNCKTTNSGLIFATYLTNSNINRNIVDRGGDDSFCISFAGTGNNITKNECRNGLTGIIGFPTRSTNQRGQISNNNIEDNIVENISEEGISLDVRGNSQTDGLAVASTTISTAVIDAVTFSDVFPNAFQQNGQFIVFQDGNRKGEYYEIVSSGGSGLGPYTLNGYSALASDIGLTVTVQMGAFGNNISNNTAINCGRDGVLVYGSFINTLVFGNRSYAYDGVNSKIRISSLAGITSEISNSFQSAHGTKLIGNETYNTNVEVTKNEFNSDLAIPPIGMIVKDNKPNIGSTFIETADLPTESNNLNLICNLNTIRSSNGVLDLIIPSIEQDSGVSELLFTYPLPSNFAVSGDVKTTVQLPQVSGYQVSRISGYRSNETTSTFSAASTDEALTKIANNPSARDISTVQITAQINSTSVFNDPATIDIFSSVTLSGSIAPSESCKCRYEINLKVLE